MFCDYVTLDPKKNLLKSVLLSDNALAVELASGPNPVLTKPKHTAFKQPPVAQKYLCPLNDVAGRLLLGKLVDLGAPDYTTVSRSPAIVQTTVQQLIDARLGQGKFRNDLLAAFSSRCPVTGLSNVALLRASHIVPWAASDTQEKLDPENGLLLAAGADAAFDCHLISFDGRGSMLTRLNVEELAAIGIHGQVSIHGRYLTSNRAAFLGRHRAESGL